jgi:hypothetical protein
MIRGNPNHVAGLRKAKRKTPDIEHLTLVVSIARADLAFVRFFVEPG